ncbi:MAG TPA: NAD(P)/FAD-dependent oxidoreductase [Actinomycetota bacterium]|nr:NAD(P)/FAD-dependent oxidoreductase [Actinomycetota bacterium]
MTERADVVVIGGGQAGLAVSHELTSLGVEHIVLERDRVASSWRHRWESFCLVTPNWAINLPGGLYDGPDPDGYLPRDELVAFFERYAQSFDAPVRQGVEVTALEPQALGGLLLRTSDGELLARSVVVATGAYQRPHRPPAASSLPPDIHRLDAEGYRDPSSLPAGRVLVIGSGQTGCQLAEELHEAGREVVLSCGRAPWTPRRLGGRDIVWWAVETGFFDEPLSALPAPAARLGANIQNTGHGGGHDLNYRTLRAAGVTLVGHFMGADDHHARFAPDLAQSVAWGDDRYHELMDEVRTLVRERGIPAPDLPEPPPFDPDAPEEMDLRDVGAVIFTSGFRPDYGTWITVPDAFDAFGFPVHVEGASSVVPGLYFVGVHFLRKRKSSLLYGVGEDAAIVARQMLGRRGS